MSSSGEGRPTKRANKPARSPLGKSTKCSSPILAVNRVHPASRYETARKWPAVPALLLPDGSTERWLTTPRPERTSAPGIKSEPGLSAAAQQKDNKQNRNWNPE